MKKKLNSFVLFVFFALFIISAFCGVSLLCFTESSELKPNNIANRVEVKVCQNLSDAVTSITSQDEVVDNAVVFLDKERDLVLDKFGNYLVSKTIFEQKTGIKIDSSLPENNQLIELANLYCYEVKDGEFNIVLVRKFGTKRLIIETENPSFDLCGAVAVSNYENLYILQYDTELQASEAYNFYLTCQDELTVSIDSLCWTENRTSETADALSQKANLNSQYNTWGAEAMKVGEYTNYLNDLLKAENTPYSELPEVVVAVLDSGIDVDHHMFKDRILKDKNGNYVGKDYTNEVKSGYKFNDLFGHGTSCAGIICDLTLPNVKILPVKFMGAWGYGNTLGSFLALDYIYEMSKQYNIVAVNLSFASELGSIKIKILESKINKLYNAGIFSVAGAGNDSKNALTKTPAAVKQAITVSAIDKNLKPASFTNYGNIIDVCAPGVDIYTATNNGGFKTVQGTSYATPHIAAYIALIKSNPTREFSMNDVEQILKGEFHEFYKDTNRDLGLKGKDSYYGYGLPICEGIYRIYFTVDAKTDSNGQVSPAGFNLYEKDHTSIKLTFQFFPNEGYQLYTVYLNGKVYSNIEWGDTEHTFKLYSTYNELYVKFRECYYVNHYLESLDYEDSSFIKYNCVNRNFYFSKIDALNAARLQSYDGFSLYEVEEKIIGENSEINVYFIRNKYSVTISIKGSANPTSRTELVAYGDDINFDFTPELGYKIKSITCNGEEINLTELVDRMDDIKSDVEFTVEYESYGFSEMNLCDFVLCILTGVILVLILLKLTTTARKKSK